MLGIVAVESIARFLLMIALSVMELLSGTLSLGVEDIFWVPFLSLVTTFSETPLVFQLIDPIPDSIGDFSVPIIGLLCYISSIGVIWLVAQQYRRMTTETRK